jgi:Na+-driven multidrug efflux pump
MWPRNRRASARRRLPWSASTWAQASWRARQIGWVSGTVGLFLTGTIGLAMALFPTVWLHLFSHDAEVVREGTIYLHIVAPAHAALGFGFVIGFAAQGTGHVLWPFVAITARILIAAGGGWLAVGLFGAGMTSLSAMVAASMIASAGISALVMLSDTVWHLKGRHGPS